MSGEKYKYLPNYTYEDYKHWEGKWELIQGIPYAMSPAPRIEHQEVSGKIHIQLASLLKACKKYKALIAIDWRLPEQEDDTVLQPDNLVICNDVKGNFIIEAPVMIFEITSPSTVLKDRYTKFNIYESQQVKYYIIVDINIKSADVFELKNNRYEKTIEVKTENVIFKLEDDCEIDFNFSEIWV